MSASPMFTVKDNKVILNIFPPIEEEFNRNVYPSTLLISFAKNGQLEKVVELLKKGADPNTRDEDRDDTALIWAVINNHLEIVKVLLEWEADPNLQGYNGYTPLIHAASRGNLEIVKVLLEWNANPYLFDHDGNNSLLWAIRRNREEVVLALLDEGMSPSWGLSTAIAANHPKLFTTLLSRGADPDAKDNREYTSMTFAILNKNTEIKEILLEWGADPNAALIGAARGGLAPVIEELLLMGADPNLRDTNNGYTPLLLAVHQGHLEATKVLLEKGADLYARDYRGYTALIEAVSHGHSEIISVLLDEGINPNLGIFAAARTGHLEAMRILLEAGADPNRQSNNESTPLTNALLYNDNVEIAETLLNSGADPNISLLGAVKHGSPVVESLLAIGADPNRQSNDESTPLTNALLYNDNVEIAETLLNSGADPNISLLGAVKHGSPVVESLLAIGADPNLPNVPLLWATANNHLNTAQLLLEWGADPNVQDRNGDTALILATRQNQLPFVEFLLGWEGIDINLPNHQGHTPLMNSVANNNLKLTIALLDAGADPNAQDNMRQTALSGAAYYSNLEAMILLLAKGADTNVQDIDGYTPLMAATYTGDISVITTLLDWGADPSLKDNEGHTAAWWASEYNDPNVAALLEAAIEKWNQKKSQ